MNTLMEQVQKQNKHPAGALSLAFSSLAQSAARQQRPNMAKLLFALAESYQIQAQNASQRDSPPGDRATELAGVLAQIQAQSQAYDAAIEQATALGERGVLRALLWGKKVAMIQNSLLNRLSKQGETMFKGQQRIHVCEACGFVSLKEDAPDVCPICKAPRERFAPL